MDFRLPIAIAVALVYSVWLAWSALKDPSNSEERLNGYATYAFAVGAFFVFIAVIFEIDQLPLADILQGKMKSTKSQGGLAFAYACLVASGVFWLASTRSKS